MKLKKIYELIIKYGINQDPRGRKISEYFKNIKSEYKKLKGHEKRLFDKESLVNPYSDTRILYGSQDLEIRKVLVGVDIETAEILLADKIREREGLDLVISHHPEGMAYSRLHEVMQVHNFLLTKLGVRKDAVDDLVKERINEVARKISSANHERAVDAARLMDMPFMCCHTPADNHVAGYLQAIMDKSRPKKIQDIVNILVSIPEYEDAARYKAGPRVILGNSKNKAGKIFVDMTGGTEGPKDLFSRISQAGVDTMICMHLSEEHFAKAKPEHINVVIAGHIASDNLGLNLILDRLESKDKLDLVCCSGFKRVKR